MICGRLSPSSGAIPHVHVCHAHTGAEDSLRVASRAVPSSTAQGRDGVARTRLRLCQTSTVQAIHSSVLDVLEEDLCGHGASSSVIPREARSGVQIDHSPEVFVEGSQDDHNVGKHAILAANVQDDLLVTLPATSGQVRALYEEEGRSISPVDSIRRATHVDSSSDRERVHTTQFDMTAGDTVSEIGVPKAAIPDVPVEPHDPSDNSGDMDVFEFGSQSDTETVDAVSEVEVGR